MKRPLSLHFPSSAFVAFFLVVASLVMASSVPAGAQENSPAATQERSNPGQPASTSNPAINANPQSGSDQQSVNSDSKPAAQEKRDDRVYISDIYPEYCRMYFHRQDWVSLFEYREGMYRCKHGNDRWW
ncbi:MAG: hypothetical protein NW224_26950 [Leptolyngbyaceae cyanobacterium bins.302]|nr:hypothetical protein [Leptolyngbyaceae cyanobacterium bins.302]